MVSMKQTLGLNSEWRKVFARVGRRLLLNRCQVRKSVMKLRRSCPQTQRPIGQHEKGSLTFFVSRTTSISRKTLHKTITYVSTANVRKAWRLTATFPQSLCIKVSQKLDIV